MTKHYTAAETAKHVRQALKEAFPSIKFSVQSKSYSGGASINICWTDGPTPDQVESIAGCFEGATFDGMTDYKGGKVHRVNGESVHWGADFIFYNRDLSDNFVQRTIDRLWNIHSHTLNSVPKPCPDDYRAGRLMNVRLYEHDYTTANEVFHRLANKHTCTMTKPAPSIQNIRIEYAY